MAAAGEWGTFGSEGNRMAKLRKAYRDGRWGQVHLRMALPAAPAGAGAPSPLLFLHQTPKSGWIWEPLFARFPDRTLVAPDTPGYGASDAPPACAEIAELADDMASLVRALQAEGTVPGGAVDVMGYHTGSVIALALAHRHPRLVRRIVCTSLPLYSPEERARRLAALPAEPALDEDGSHLLRQWNAIRGFTDQRASLAWRQASLTENLRSGPGQYSGYRAVYRHDLQASLAALAHPLLILNPHDDLLEQTRAARKLAAGCSYLELPGLAHGLFAIEQDMIASAVRDFLDNTAPATSLPAELRT